MSPPKHQGLRQFGLSHPTQPELRISAFHTTSLPVASNASGVAYLLGSTRQICLSPPTHPELQLSLHPVFYYNLFLTLSAVSGQKVSEISTRMQSLSLPTHPESCRV